MSVRVNYIDLETSPLLAHVWGLRDQNIGLNQIIKDPEIIGVGYRWDDMRSARYLSLWEEGRDDMLLKTHAMLDEADVVVHYNGDRFDIPWLNGEWARLGITPPSPFKSLDLFKVVKKNFRFPSYKLDYVSNALLGQRKLETGGHGLWVACLEGDERARARMARYCRRDVDLLPRLLKVLRPWLGNQINFALLGGAEDAACPKCESTSFQARGYAYTATSAYPQYRCNSCGAWWRGTKREFGSPVSGVTR